MSQSAAEFLYEMFFTAKNSCQSSWTSERGPAAGTISQNLARCEEQQKSSIPQNRQLSRICATPRHTQKGSWMNQRCVEHLNLRRRITPRSSNFEWRKLWGASSTLGPSVRPVSYLLPVRRMLHLCMAWYCISIVPIEPHRCRYWDKWKCWQEILHDANCSWVNIYIYIYTCKHLYMHI